jgi:hypothetical protein
MPPSSPLTEQDIWKIAHRTTDIIQSNITRNVCLFGSAACSLWVNIGRVPRVRRATRFYPFYFFLPLKMHRIQNAGHRYCRLRAV